MKPKDLLKNKNKTTVIKFNHRAKTLSKSVGVGDNFMEKLKMTLFKEFGKNLGKKSTAIERVIEKMKPQTPAEYLVIGWGCMATSDFFKNKKTELLLKTLGFEENKKYPKTLH